MKGTSVEQLAEIPDCQEPGFGRVCAAGPDHMICSNEKRLFDLDLETAKLAEIPWPDADMDPELISETGLFDYDQKPLLYIQ